MSEDAMSEDAAKDKAPPKGLYCRNCWGQWFRVVSTRRLTRGRIRRRRVCQHCGKSLYTTETDVANPSR